MRNSDCFLKKMTAAFSLTVLLATFLSLSAIAQASIIKDTVMDSKIVEAATSATVTIRDSNVAKNALESVSFLVNTSHSK